MCEMLQIIHLHFSRATCESCRMEINNNMKEKREITDFRIMWLKKTTLNKKWLCILTAVCYQFSEHYFRNEINRNSQTLVREKDVIYGNFLQERGSCLLVSRKSVWIVSHMCHCVDWSCVCVCVFVCVSLLLRVRPFIIYMRGICVSQSSSHVTNPQARQLLRSSLDMVSEHATRQTLSSW